MCEYRLVFYLCEGLQWCDEAAVLDLDVGQISRPVAAVQSHLGILPDLVLCSLFLLGRQM